MEKKGYDLDKIKKQIDKYNYISFDLFDTLIKREVGSVKNVFEFIKKQYKRKYNESIENFFDMRKEAEKKAIKKYKEPSLDEIYSELNNSTLSNRLKKIEEEIEMQVCIQNKDFYPIYEYCIKNSKKILITTDMYLSKNCIIKILNNANIKYDYLFISSENHVTKKDGTLFQYILQETKLNRKELCHIGDSKKSDYIVPKFLGIKSILIPKRINKLSYCNKNENKLLSIYINCNLNTQKNELYKIGFQTLGPILYFYSKYLLKELKKYNINQVYFLAREGYILKKAFDIVNTDKNIKSNYFYASRQSLRIPLLCECKSLDETMNLLNMRRITTLKDFFINIGLNIKEYKDIIKEFNYTENTNISDKKFEEFYNKIYPYIKENSEIKRKNLIGYLKTFNFERNLAISDVGWTGTMQKALSILFNNVKYKINMNGFYVGLNDTYKSNPECDKMHQYLFEKEGEYIKVRGFLNLFESFFLAGHGTTLYYEKKNGQYVPVLDEYEYDEKESKLYENIQKGAIDFVEKFNSNHYKEFYNPTAKEVFSYIEKLGIEPSNKDIEIFGNMPYVETTKNFMAHPKKIRYYITHPKIYYIDFCNCSWKIGFLKKSLKMKLNYFRLYKLLDKISKFKLK